MYNVIQEKDNIKVIYKFANNNKITLHITPLTIEFIPNIISILSIQDIYTLRDVIDTFIDVSTDIVRYSTEINKNFTDLVIEENPFEYLPRIFRGARKLVLIVPSSTDNFIIIQSKE